MSIARLLEKMQVRQYNTKGTECFDIEVVNNILVISIMVGTVGYSEVGLHVVSA